MIRKIKLDFVIWSCLQILALAVTLFALGSVVPAEKSSIGWLPLGYMLVNTLFFCNFNQFYYNPSKVLIFTMTFIRLVVLPGLYLPCIDLQLFKGHASVINSFESATYLMLYEYFGLHLMIFIYDRFLSKKRAVCKNTGKYKNYCGYILLFIMAYLLLVILFFPERLSTYKTILTLTDPEFTTVQKLELAIGGLKRSLFTLFNFLLQIFRILGPVYILEWIHRKKPQSVLTTWVLVLSCVLQFFCLTSTFAEALVSCLTISLAYLYLYPTHIKRVFFSFSVFCIGMGGVFFLVRFLIMPDTMYNSTMDTIIHFAGKVNAYFTGIDNVAAIFNIPDGHQLETLKVGLLGAIPFNTTLMGNLGNRLQYYFNFYNMGMGNIPPTIGSGYYFLGAPLAPIFTMVFVGLSLKYNDWAKTASNVLKQASLQFCSIVFALGTVMYGAAITMVLYVSWGIPMICLTAFAIREQRKKYE